MDAIEAEVTDVWISELQTEFPDVTLTVTAGQTLMTRQNRHYHRRISARPADLKLLQDRLTMAGLTWIAVPDSSIRSRPSAAALGGAAR